MFNNALYFGADDGVHGMELWKYDGNIATLAADIKPGSQYSSSFPLDLTVFNNALYFRADDGTGAELWQYDGNLATLVADINPTGPSYPNDFRVFNKALYFSATYWGLDPLLFKYDGNSPPDIPGSNQLVSKPHHLTVFDNALFFRAYDAFHGRELWNYDGNSAELVADINPGNDGSKPAGFTVFNNALYFGANALYFGADDGIHGRELWCLKPFYSLGQLYMFIYPDPLVFPPPGDPWKWVLTLNYQGEKLETTMGVFALTDDQPAQLLNRTPLHLSESMPGRNMAIFSTPRIPRRLPPAIAFLMVMFNNNSGERIVVETDVIGAKRELDRGQIRTLTRKAEAFAKRLTLARLNAMSIGDLRGSGQKF